MSSPWLTVTHTKASTLLREYQGAWGSLHISHSSRPSMTLMIGRRVKSEILSQLIKGSDRGFLGNGHGQVHLWPDPESSDSTQPRIFVDFELQSQLSVQDTVSGQGPEVHRLLDWVDHACAPLTRRRIDNSLAGRVLGCMSDVICCFASDMSGIRGVAAFIADQVKQDPPSDLPIDLLPRMLVVVDTASASYDSALAERDLLTSVKGMLSDCHRFNSGDGIHTVLRRYYREVRVLGILKSCGRRDRARRVRRMLTSMSNDSIASKTHGCVRYNFLHVKTLLGRMLDHFCEGKADPFSFILRSRAAGLSLESFAKHIRELWDLLPSESWFCHLACPLLVSSILLSSYPPGCHDFPVTWVYRSCFEQSVRRLLDERVVSSTTRQAYMRKVQQALVDEHASFTREPQIDKRTMHRRRLDRLHQYLSDLKSHKTCLSCLLAPPEKVLTCGHALCDACVRICGRCSKEEKNTFIFESCPLCGRPNSRAPFRLLPKTAGIRILSLDGGGVRGIVSLMFLRDLERRLAMLHVPLQEHFDFVCGTSAGGLIALGLFLMQWPVQHCIAIFEQLATRTFRSKKKRSLLLSQMHHYATSFFRDCQYGTQAIEEAFVSRLGDHVKMFNPLSDDTRVAVTTTTAKNSRPCIFTNYNGDARRDSKGYSLIRAERHDEDVTLSDAASCTSAAPGFFKSKALERLGTFQDGGLQHNNPINVALWETRALWPAHASPDLAVSIGTGKSDNMLAAFDAGPHSPVRDRFLSRLCRTFLKSMDGEKIWQDLQNSLSEHDRKRFVRLNVPIVGQEPLLDDAKAMEDLKELTSSHLSTSADTARVVDGLLASIFYFEFEEQPVWDGSAYRCIGNIFCRLRLPSSGRKALQRLLVDSSAYFLVHGTPVRCISRALAHPAPFKRRVRFQLGALDETVGITIRGITSCANTISGLPQTAQDILSMQMLDAPFGRFDQLPSEKSLPALPRKRKISELDTDWI